MSLPQIILLFSGKRKSGKDYICENLKKIIGDKECTIVRISEPIKSIYAKSHGLDINELLSDSPYKENYRLDMIKWSDTIRSENKGYFCKIACENAQLKPIWLISDIRRKTDIEWFEENYSNKLKLIRISSDLDVRKERGWKFTEGVDDVVSECNLDDFTKWNLIISNNNQIEFENGIKKILLLLKDN